MDTDHSLAAAASAVNNDDDEAKALAATTDRKRKGIEHRLHPQSQSGRRVQE